MDRDGFDALGKMWVPIECARSRALIVRAAERQHCAQLSLLDVDKVKASVVISLGPSGDATRESVLVDSLRRRRQGAGVACSQTVAEMFDVVALECECGAHEFLID